MAGRPQIKCKSGFTIGLGSHPTPPIVQVIVGGVQKAGTTSLAAYFRDHPSLVPPLQKETHFFDNEDLDWQRPKYELLHSFYPTYAGHGIPFDVTPIYIFWPPSLQRIRIYNHYAMLIFLFRDPIERAWSQWCMEFARGSDSLSFAEAIRKGRERLRNLDPLAFGWRVFSYVERGFYASQVRRVLELFQRDQLLFLRSADLRDHPWQTLRTIAGFLNIDTFVSSEEKWEHERPAATAVLKPSREDIAYLREVFYQEVVEFSALTGLSVDDWPTIDDDRPVA